MSTEPNEIRRDIERTRAELSDNVNALGDSAKPGNLVREQVDNVKEGARGLKERIFGSDTDRYDDGALGDVTHRASGAVADARDAVTDAPRQLKSSTRGNPIAAGLIAAGLGALIGGLIPPTRLEKEKASQLAEAAEPAVEQVKELANEAKEHLQPMAEEAVDSLKGVAKDAGDNVKTEAEIAKDDVAEQARASADTVRTDAQQQVDEVRSDDQRSF